MRRLLWLAWLCGCGAVGDAGVVENRLLPKLVAGEMIDDFQCLPPEHIVGAGEELDPIKTRIAAGADRARQWLAYEARCQKLGCDFHSSTDWDSPMKRDGQYYFCTAEVDVWCDQMEGPASPAPPGIPPLLPSPTPLVANEIPDDITCLEPKTIHGEGTDAFSGWAGSRALSARSWGFYDYGRACEQLKCNLHFGPDLPPTCKQTGIDWTCDAVLDVWCDTI